MGVLVGLWDQAETSAATVEVKMAVAVETMSTLMMELAAETRAGMVVAPVVAMMGAILIAQRWWRCQRQRRCDEGGNGDGSIVGR